MQAQRGLKMTQIMIRLIVVVGVCLLFNPSKALPDTERRIALVIGNGGYTSAPLRNPVHDATDMAAALQKLGFDVIHLKEASQREMENAIR